MDEENEEKEKVYATKNGAILVRNEDGKCWLLSPRDFAGKKDEDELEFLGKFRLCY